MQQWGQKREKRQKQSMKVGKTAFEVKVALCELGPLVLLTNIMVLILL